MTTEFKFGMGIILKDVITGFTGVVMARSQYYTGCTHYGLCPTKLTKDGKEPDWLWLDETRLVETKSKPIVLFKREQPTSGQFQDPPKV